MYLLAIFFAVNLAFSALSSDIFLSMNPSPLHSEQIPEPPQSSHVFEEASATSEVSAFRLRNVAAATTIVAATVTETAVSGSARNVLTDDVPRVFALLTYREPAYSWILNAEFPV